MNRHTETLQALLVVCNLWCVLLLPQVGSAQLPAGRSVLRNGKFLQDPARPVHWVTRFSGNLGKFALLPPEGDNDSAILKVDVQTSSTRPWTLELRQSLAAKLQKNEVFYVSFEYKLTEGYAFHCYWQRDVAPWPKFLSIRFFEPAGQWHKVSMAVRIPQDLSPRETSLTFHLAEKKGSVQMRDFRVMVYPEDVALESLPTNAYPVFGGDYYDRDWRNKALAVIDRKRKASLSVRVTRGKQPVPGAAVTVTQKRGEFFFGTEVTVPLFHAQALERPELAAVRERLAGVEDRIEKYRNFILRPGVFSVVSPREALIWRTHEAWGKSITGEVVDQFLGHGMQVRGHALYCPAFRFAPPACRQMKKDQLQQALETFMTNAVGKYGGKIFQWDVLHAPITYREMYELLGPESLPRAFKVAAGGAGEAGLLFSDDRALMLPNADHLEEMLEMIKWLRSEGVELSAVGLQAVLRRPYIAPQAIENRLNRVAEDTRLPIVITRLAIDAPKEKIQAEILRNLLILFFSHEAVSGVVLGDVWDANLPTGKSGLFRRDFAIKPAGKAFLKLVAEDWRTEVTMKTGADGTAVVSGFLGDYQVRAQAGDSNVARNAKLVKGGSKVTIDLADGG